MPADVSSANESGGAESGASSSAATATATANGGGVSASGGSGALGGSQATGGASIKTYSSAATGGRSASSSSTATAGGTKASTQSGTGGATKVSNRCSAVYEPCAYEPSCESFGQTEEGGCLYSSFVCGKYTGWSFTNGPDFVGENGTPSSAQAFIEYSNYLTKNCSTGAGGASGNGGASTAGGVAAKGGSTATATSSGGASSAGGATVRSTVVANCTDNAGTIPCQYHNDPSDPSQCIGEPLPEITKCKSVLTAACNRGYGAYYCWRVCSECELWGPNSPECGNALKAVPPDISSCSTAFPER